MDRDIQEKVQAAIAAGAPREEAFSRGMALQQRRNESSKQPTVSSPIPQQKSFGGFAGNVGRDIGENIQGLLAIPGLLGSLLSGKADLGQTGQAVGKGIFEEYKNLVTNPVETAYQKPVSTILDILPFMQLGKLAFAGKAGKAGKAAKIAETTAKAGPLAGTGAGLRAGVTNPKVLASPYGAKAEQSLAQISDVLKLKGSAAAKYSQLPAKMDDISSVIKTKLIKDKKPVGIAKTFGSLDDALDKNINFDHFYSELKAEMEAKHDKF